MLSGEHLLRLPVLTQGSGEKFPSKAEFLTNIFEAPRRALYPSLLWRDKFFEKFGQDI